VRNLSDSCEACASTNEGTAFFARQRPRASPAKIKYSDRRAWLLDRRPAGDKMPSSAASFWPRQNRFAAVKDLDTLAGLPEAVATAGEGTTRVRA
jgi:hypothetical protein